MRPAGARASNPPTECKGLWEGRPPITTPPPKTTPRKKPETLAEENARLRARVAELEAVASMAARRGAAAAQLDVSSAAEPIRQRLESSARRSCGYEALVERQAKALTRRTPTARHGGAFG